MPLEPHTREFSGKTEVWNSLGGDKISQLVHSIGSGSPRSFWFHVVTLLMVLQHVLEQQWDTRMSRIHSTKLHQELPGMPQQCQCLVRQSPGTSLGSSLCPCTGARLCNPRARLQHRHIPGAPSHSSPPSPSCRVYPSAREDWLLAWPRAPGIRAMANKPNTA